MSYLTEAHNYLTARQAAFSQLIEPYPRYFWDQGLGTIAFCDSGEPQVIARFLVVGSTSTKGGTWLWSWDNDSINQELSAPMLEVRSVGEKRGFERLTDPIWPADEVDGWEMSSVAGFVLEADGAYKSPDEDGALFLLIFEPEQASESTQSARCE